MHLVYAAILGVIEGLTEFLPISSTAHLIIAERLLGFDDPGGIFTVMIQLGAILAVVWLYRARIIEVVAGLPTKPEARRFALAVIVAFLPAMITVLALKRFANYDDVITDLRVIAYAFIGGGIAMLLIERFRPTPKIEDARDTPVLNALGIGIFQTLALIPGMSRSGATIFGGLLMRLDRRAAAEFSFFLAMPTMVAAFAYDFWKVKDHLGDGRTLDIAVGFVFAFISALIVVRLFLAFVTRVGFMPFAGYRILAGAALLAAISAGFLT
ncbi:MAG: undecaprenyl-diphosphate phosphatase [Vitreimonas sp.]